MARPRQPTTPACTNTHSVAHSAIDESPIFVGYVPGFPGAHSQGETLDELNQNLAEVIGMLLEDGEPQFEPVESASEYPSFFIEG